MAAIIIQKRRLRQPNVPVGLNRANHLTNGLVFAGLPFANSAFDVVSNQLALPTASGELFNLATAPPAFGIATPDAMHLRCTGGTARLEFPVQSTGLDLITGPFTIFVEGGPSADSQLAIAIGSNEDALGDGLLFKFDDTLQVFNGFSIEVNFENLAFSDTDALGANSFQNTHRCAITCDGTNARFYASGNLNKTQALANLPTANGSRRTVMFGDTVENNVGDQAQFAVTLAWNRVLSLDEYRSLYLTGPWQLFRPLQQRIYIEPPAAASVTITAEQGTYAKTGQDARFNLGFKSDQGIYTDAGQAARLDTAILPAQASYVYTGQDARLRATFSVVAEQGQYTVTGQVVRLDTALIPGQGAYLYTGQAARLDIALIPSQGTYTYTGQDAALIAALTTIVTAEQGSYALSGHDAFFNLGIAVAQGTISLTGQDANFDFGFKVDQGIYTLTGQDASLIAPITLDAEQGIYSVVGEDAALRVVRRAVVSQAGDDYPWPERDFKREYEARKRLQRQLAEVVEGLEARAETVGPQAKAAAKTLRQARRRYGQVLEFDRMLEEVQSIRRIFVEYAGPKFAQVAIEAYQSQRPDAISTEEALQAYEHWEAEHVRQALEAASEFSQLVDMIDAAKVRSDRH